MTPWRNHPNAKHIDQVIEHMQNLGAWKVVFGTIGTLDASYAKATDLVDTVEDDATWVAVRDVLRDVASNKRASGDSGVIGLAACALLALVACDNCSAWLESNYTSETLRRIIQSEPDNHAARLLLPYKIFLESLGS